MLYVYKRTHNMIRFEFLGRLLGSMETGQHLVKKAEVRGRILTYLGGKSNRIE